MAFKFNPFTGTFDVVPTQQDFAKEFAREVPTYTSIDFIVAEDTQKLFSKRIILQDGTRVILEGLLIEVN